MYARALPQFNPDGTVGASPTRTGSYGEAYVTSISNKEFFAADEGSHFVAVTGTPRTGIIGHAAPTTFDETKAFLLIYNSNTVKNIYLQSIALLDTVVSVGDTQTGFTLTTDTGNLLSSGGTGMTINNVNKSSSNTSKAIITCGAVVCSAATSTRSILGDYIFRGANIDVVWDQFEFNFGGVTSTPPTTPTPTTLAAHFTRTLHPVIIGPGQCFKLHQWAASQSTGPTFQTIVSFIER